MDNHTYLSYIAINIKNIINSRKAAPTTDSNRRKKASLTLFLQNDKKRERINKKGKKSKTGVTTEFVKPHRRFQVREVPSPAAAFEMPMDTSCSPVGMLKTSVLFAPYHYSEEKVLACDGEMAMRSLADALRRVLWHFLDVFKLALKRVFQISRHPLHFLPKWLARETA